jgi:radical SAM-linked protein
MEEGGSMVDESQAAIRFRIGGALRFLSHAETARLWQRACARAALPVRYSEGFNPHPRMSLPLPRPVGVESDEELLVVKLRADCPEVAAGSRTEREAALTQALAAQLPAGMEVLEVNLAAAQASFRPQAAEYVLPVRVAQEPDLAERLRSRMAAVMESESCLVARASGEGTAARSIDVRPFLCAMRLEDGNVVVQHRTDGTGSIRVEEIMQLLGLRTQDLAGPVRRTHVVWEIVNHKS